MKNIIVAGGCFWGVEAYFKLQNYVKDTTVGYVNSKVEKPDYKLVCTGMTHAAEAVYIEYEGELTEVLKTLFHIIDPVILNRQGPDCGTQYRTGIYYKNEEDRKIIEEFIKEEQKKYDSKIVTEVLPAENFYEAEAYHQDYLDKNPGGYCHINLNA